MRLFLLGLLSSFSIAYSCEFTIALRQSEGKVEEINRLAREVSDPLSSKYGQYLQPEEIDSLVYDDHLEMRRQRVFDWLDKTQHQIVKDYTDAVVVKHSDCQRVGLPDLLLEDVAFVTRVGSVPRPNPKVRVVANPQVDPGYVGREVVQRIYQIDDYNVSNASSCAIEFSDGGSGFSEDNLVEYEKGNLNSPHNITSKHIHGSVGSPDTESQLDVQMLSNANNSQLWYWIFDKWIYEMASEVVHTSNIPYVLSISYGWAEHDQCTIIGCSGNMTSASYIDRTNIELAKLVLRGISVVVASGDAGAPGRTAEGCASINPVFPGSSPFVTSVGAVSVLKGSEKWNYRTPLCLKNGCANGTALLPTMFSTTSWTSGGGFAIYDSETRPWYQDREVKGYLNQTGILPPKGNFNSKGRGYPDVAVIGHNCAVYGYGGVQPIDGTSCSCPLFASMLTVLNHHQVSRGHPRIGFANPILYHLHRLNPKTFTDITTGNNHATEYGSCNASMGFVASKGWDPVAGLGSPNIREIIQTLDTFF